MNKNISSLKQIIVFVVIILFSHTSFSEINDYVARWTMDRFDGNRVLSDLNGLDAIFQEQVPSGDGVIRVPGRYKNALLFTGEATDNGKNANGYQNYLEVSGVKNLDFSQGLTFSTWVYYRKFNSFSRLFDFGLGKKSYNVLLANEGESKNLIFSVFGETNPCGSTYCRLTAENELELNTWMHIAVTIDASGDATLYRDGEALASRNLGPIPYALRTKNYIGKSNWSFDGPLDAYLDDVTLYTRALSSTEIYTLMNANDRWGDKYTLSHRYTDSSENTCNDDQACSMYLSASDITSLKFEANDLYEGGTSELRNIEWRINYIEDTPYFIIENAVHRTYLSRMLGGGDEGSLGLINYDALVDENGNVKDEAQWRLVVASAQNDISIINKFHDTDDAQRQHLVINGAFPELEKLALQPAHKKALFSLDSMYINLRINPLDIDKNNSRLRLSNNLVVNQLFTPTPRDTQNTSVQHFEFHVEHAMNAPAIYHFASTIEVANAVLDEEGNLTEQFEREVIDTISSLADAGGVLENYDVVQLKENIIQQLRNAKNGNSTQRICEEDPNSSPNNEIVNTAYSGGVVWFYDDTNTLGHNSCAPHFLSQVSGTKDALKVMTNVSMDDDPDDYFGILIKTCEGNVCGYIIDDPTRGSQAIPQ